MSTVLLITVIKFSMKMKTAITSLEPFTKKKTYLPKTDLNITVISFPQSVFS